VALVHLAQTLLPVGSGQNLIAFLFERAGDKLAQGQVVVNDKYRCV